MASNSSELEHLARVFLTGFHLDPKEGADNVWRFIRPEFDLLVGTLPDDDALEFSRIVDDMVRTMTANEGEAPAAP